MPTEDGGRRALPHGLLGLAESCHVGDVESTARVVVDRAVERVGGYVCLCNVHLLTAALHDADVHRALEGAWMRLPDGAPIAWVQRRMGIDGAHRIGGPDLMPRVVDVGRDHELRHFLLGSTPDVLDRVRDALDRAYPGARVVGAFSPPFSDRVDLDQTALEAIRSAGAEIVWCALGAPKQEQWMYRSAAMLPGIVLVGVGAAFDFLATTKQRAPRWMQDRGLEWLHRLGSEPRRLGGRYVRTNSEFLVRIGLEMTRRRLAA